jgi:uncharacterized protein YodC (DUF2158 family)
MSEKFKAGDVVRLRSGGPNMTIVKYANYSFYDGIDMKYLCRWFDSKNVKFEHTFTEPELELVHM